jgi:hypothetical protein
MKLGVRSQEVTDAQGRRRFHGAFTGGFSAGYFNSVGTEEGWAPRTFSSSRGNRASAVQQRPEDFMDEEDDPLLGKRLETTERYDTLQTGAKRWLQQQQGAGAAVIPGFALPDDWVLPVNDSIGAKLLKQMGWKEGHGIGQRVRRRKFQKEEKEPKRLAQEAAQEPLVEEKEVYVPPRKVFDVAKSFPTPKVDRYGAGFDPYTDAPEFSMHKQHEQEKQRAKEGTHRQVVSFLDALKTTSSSNRATTGYGLSALEENDDIDVYGTVSMQEFDQVIAPLGARANVKRLDSSAQESRRYEKARRSRALCSDGRAVLPGFELASAKEKPPNVVNLRLVVPSGFKANHRFADEDATDDAVTALYRKFKFSADKNSNGRVVTAKQRGVLLRDDQQDRRGDADSVRAAADEAKSSTGSIFEMLSEEQRARLFDAAAQAKQGLLPPPVVRAAALANPAVPTVRQPLVHDSGGDQFRASISASIAKRFVSSKATADKEARENSPAEIPHAKVSRRSQSLWVPKSLLCKRFHVKCSGPTGSNGGGDDDTKQDLFDKELVPHLVEFAAGRAARLQPESETQGLKKPLKIGEVECTGDEDLPPLPVTEKSAASLLKSIFEPSDEELSEDESDDESDEDESGNARDRTTGEGDGELPIGTATSSRKDTVVGASVVDALPRDQGEASSADSSSSDAAEGILSSLPGAEDGNEDEKRGIKRPHNTGGVNDAEQRQETKKHKKHKKKHKHRSREEKDKKRKKRDKKDRQSHRSSRHSRRSGSRSAGRSSSRHRSSSSRHD